MSDTYWTSPRSIASRIGRRTILRGGAIGVVGAAGLALVGCGGSSSSKSKSGGSTVNSGGGGAVQTSAAVIPAARPAGVATSTPAAENPVRGGTMRVGYQFAALGIDPHIETSVGLVTSSKLYSFLGALNINDNVWHPILSQSYEQPSNTEYLFHLRPNAKWQEIAPVSGRAVVADDVVYSFSRFRDLPQATRNGYFKTTVDQMTAVDANTFKLTTKVPYADTFGVLGVGDGVGPQTAIVAKEDVEKRGDLSNGGVGSGPFILDSYTKGEKTALKRNPNYFDSTLPYLDQWTQITITDNNTLLQAYKSDQLDLNGASITKLDFDDLSKNNNLVNQRVPTLGNGCFEMDAGSKPFNDPRVRQAVKIGMDRSQFINKIFFGEGTAAGAISSGLKFWALPLDQIKPYVGPDVQKAKQLMSAAGYPNGFDLDILTSGAISVYLDYANIVVPELKKIGINATLKVMDLPTFLSQHMYAGNFPSTVWVTNGYPTLQTPLFYYHKNGLGNGNWWHYSNDQASALIDQQSQELDANKRQQLVLQVQKMVLDDWAPHMPIIDGTGYSSYNKRLGGYDPLLASYQLLRYSEFIKQS